MMDEVDLDFASTYLPKAQTVFFPEEELGPKSKNFGKFTAQNRKSSAVELGIKNAKLARGNLYDNSRNKMLASASAAGNVKVEHVNDGRIEPGVYQSPSGGVVISWGPKGTEVNKNIMLKIKNEAPGIAAAMSINKRIRENFPYTEYGAHYKRRGTPEGIDYFGETGKLANAVQKARRKESGWIGRGYYSNTGYGARGQGGYFGRQLGMRAGQFIGNKFGMGDLGGQAGGMLGDWASDQLSNKARSYMHGRGAYSILGDTTGNMASSGGSVEHNQLINHPNPSRQLGTVQDETNSITLTHSEYIRDISPTSTSFESQVFLAINPGLSGTFPWLANIAQFYEEYEFKQLAFTFKSMVTEGNSSASGTVIMATQYNPTNAAFSSKQVMENYDYASSSKVTSDSHHGIECDPAKKGGSAIEYVRTGAIPTNQDLKTYDLATFQLATTGAAANLTIGELWVSYQIVLRKTKIPTVGQTGRLNALYCNITGGTSSSNLFTGTNVIASNLTGFSVSGYTLTFPSQIATGNYMFTLKITCTVQPTAIGTLGGVGIGSTQLLNDNVSYGTATDDFILCGSFTINNTTTGLTTLTLPVLTGITGNGIDFRLRQVFSDI